MSQTAEGKQQRSSTSHVQISIPASSSAPKTWRTSPSRTKDMPSSGLHERKPSELAQPSIDYDEESSSTTGTDTFASRALKRVQTLVKGQQSWWTSDASRRGLTRGPPGTPGRGTIRRDLSTKSPLMSRLESAMNVFFVTEDQRFTPASSTIPLPPMLASYPAPSPLLASTTRISTSPSYARSRRPTALSRTGWLAVTVLFLLGLRELIFLSRLAGGRGEVKIRGRDPFAALAELKATARKPKGSQIPGTGRLWKRRPASLKSGQTVLEQGVEQWASSDEEGDTTAIVLHWKRTDNVKVIVADLCQYSFFETIFVWNNNPNIHLTRKHFASSLCPASRLRIYNSPRNMLFVSRYLACAQGSTPYCFFQDDDWLVRPLRSIYSHFKRDPEGPVVVSTSSEVSALYGLEWCFYQSPLHTCFSWVGTGAFSAKSHVTRFLSTLSDIGYTADEVAHADNSFTLFQNEPPYVLSGDLIQLPSPYGHSDGEGIQKNKDFIQKGLVHLTDYLAHHSPTPPQIGRVTTLLHTPNAVSSTPYLAPPKPPLAPHPYSHHARSPCHSDSCVFLTSIPLLPPPDAIPYPGAENVGLEQWENHLGWVARGWMEGGEIWAEEETWAKSWPYAAAVDGREGTAFRSPDVIHAQDYIALGLLKALDVASVPLVSFSFILEEVEKVLEAVVFEVSADGYRWFPPAGNPSPASCTSTSRLSTAPDVSFPLSSLISPSALAIRSSESLAASGFALTQWLSRRRRSQKLKECTIVLSSVYEEEVGGGSGLEGWRFVRMRAKEGRAVGWGVYELRLEPPH